MILPQWCLPVVKGRGAGLGNELVPWARAYLMSTILGARCLRPAFGINARGYHRHFGTSRLDFALNRVIAGVLPRVHFGEAQFEEHGGGDVIAAFKSFAAAQGLYERRPLLVTTDGMWGGLLHVARAREFVRATLYGTHYAAPNLAALAARLEPEKLTVALHVRLGDFEPSTVDAATYRGRFNCALPLSWFMGIGEQLLKSLGGLVQFQVFSDGTPEQLAPLLELLKPVDTTSRLPADVSDLLAMSQADLLVCSVSSYSVWAAALSSAPYLWFSPQMYRHGDAGASIWGHEDRQLQTNSPTMKALAARAANGDTRFTGRAYPVGIEEKLPTKLMDSLQRRAQEKRFYSDLVCYGTAPLATEKSISD